MATIDAVDPGQVPAAEGIVETEAIRQNKLLVEPAKQPEQPKPEPVDYQKVADKLGNELGELRAQNRELLSKLENIENPPPPVEPVPSFQEDPEAFIRRTVQDAITTSVAPNLDRLTEYQTVQQNREFQAELVKMHDDAPSVVSSEEFQNWVKASPARVRQYEFANSYDLDSANELLTRYKQDMARQKQDQTAMLGAAHTLGGGNSGMDSGKKTFKASDIQRLMQDNPDEYQRWLRTEGHLAYREGRVLKDY